jgi:hypothetical protein
MASNARFGKVGFLLRGRSLAHGKSPVSQRAELGIGIRNGEVTVIEQGRRMLLHPTQPIELDNVQPVHVA